jgi:TonB-linked SusC/RagA family outer membrane protein
MQGMSFVRPRLVATLVGLVTVSGSLAAQGGAVSGVVVNERSLLPIAAAQVTVVGGNRTVTSDARGQFRLDGLSGGEVSIRVTAIGFRPVTQTVRPGDASVRVVLTETAVKLDELVITGEVGAVAKRTVANAISTISAAEVVDIAPVTDVSQLIRGRAAGALVRLSTGALGGGSRITLRGASTIGLNDQPLIYVDGVRVDNTNGVGLTNEGAGTPNGAISRLNDFSPEQIESIEIIKGPAAATLYGTEASNGVIQIITKKGRRGQGVRWDAGIRQGTTWFQSPETRFQTIYGLDANQQIITLNPYQLALEQGEQPYKNGYLQGYSASAAGGTDVLQYFAGGQFDHDKGTDDTQRLSNASGRVNLVITPSDKVTMSTNLSYLRGHQQTPNDGNFGGPIFAFDQVRPSLLNTVRQGWLFGSPGQWQRGWKFLDDVNRFTSSIQISHRPFSWLNHRLTAGADLLGDNFTSISQKMPPDLAVIFGASLARGSAASAARNVTNTTLDYGASAEAALGKKIKSTTSLGLQYFHKVDKLVTANGVGFPAEGLTTISATATRVSGETFFENNSVGLYVQEQIGLSDRLFVTGAVRADDNSAFGSNFSAAYYPKASLSWVMSDEPFWKLGLLNTFKFRAAYGQSGKQPDVNTALQTFVPVTGGGGAPAVTPGTIGNPDLKPERGNELEVGFDAGLKDDRIGVEFTYYNKRTKDAIVAAQLPPSGGFPGARFVNVGEVSSKGVELLVNAGVIRTKNLGLDLTLNLATNSSTVISTGSSSGFIAIAGAQQRQADGFPVGAWFAQRVISATLNPTTKLAENILCDGGTGPHNLMPGGAGVPCGTAPAVYLGRAFPKTFGSISPHLMLFNRLELFALVDFQRGFKRVNSELSQNCSSGTCEERFYPERFDPVRVANQQLGLSTAFALQDASFFKFREASIKYTFPDRWARSVSASRIAASVAAQNLHTWTSFGGLDPEPTRLSSPFIASGGNILPPNSTLLLRLDLTF